MNKWAGSALVMIGVGIIGVLMSFRGEQLLTFGTEPVLQEKTLSVPSDVKELQLALEEMDVKVVRTNSAEVKLRLEGRASKQYVDKFKLDAHIQGDKLVVSGANTKKFSIGVNIMDVDLTVSLPSNVWNSIDIGSDSGNIEAADLEGSSLDIRAGSGNIRGDGLHANKMSYYSGSGNLRLSGVTGETAMVKLGSGNVVMNDYRLEQLEYKLSSGNVTLRDGSGSVSGRLGSGNVNIYTDRIDHLMRLYAGSGNISVYTDQKPEGLQVKFKTGSGNRSIQWEGFSYEDKDGEGAIGSFAGSGSGVLEVQTGSGNFKLGQK
ncbi:DUF4097 domain-containing protein [Paenibacillus sp. GCM10023252]|uniref:DUF4097 family beta strand repeat-containing protein n=1 Tax=Paenibacillus sp. GCM10023252 TaxID=3252649 RepID=UPI0036114129